MRVRFILRPTIFTLSLLAVGWMLFAPPQSWAQAAETPAAPNSPGLFPNAAEPVLVEKATLRGLLAAMARQDGETAGPMIWQLLAAMSKARELGTGPSEFLAAGYRAERLKGSEAADVQNCLLSAWAGAQTMALFTPENIAWMEQGTAPHATRGLERGRVVNLDTGMFPAVTMTTQTLAPKTAAAPAPAAPAAVESVAPPLGFVLKKLDVRLHEQVSLDACGLRNMDFRLDSVDPHGSVIFLFQDRTVHHFGDVNQWASLSDRNKSVDFSEGVNRTTAFTPELIPDTKTRGVKLMSLPFATLYLDEDIGAQLSMHLVIRVAAEALMLDQLPPDRRKLYEIHNSP